MGNLTDSFRRIKTSEKQIDQNLQNRDIFTC